MTDRISHPLIHHCGVMLIVEPYNARVVNHLRHEDNIVLGLHNLVIVVVDDRHHRWPSAGVRGTKIPKQETALSNSLQFGSIGYADARLLQPLLSLREMSLGSWQIRNLTVRRVDNHRCAVLSIDADNAVTTIEPERIVASGCVAIAWGRAI